MKRIPDDVIRRLPMYLRKLDDLSKKGEKRVSSGELSRMLRMEPSQLRKDLDWFGGFPRQNLAYDIDDLLKAIAEILGTNEEFSVIFVGPGKIGSALMQNFEFIVEGYTVLGAFDVSPDMIGKEIAGVPVYDMAELGDFVKEHKVDIAIMTVPRDPAQAIADTLVASGIRAIWNFTNEDLEVGDADVFVENVHFSDSLLHLNYYLAKNSKE